MRHDQDKKVSVIIPAYNAQESLQRCVESVLGQTVQPFELIIINDGSTDDTAAVANIFDSESIYVEQENLGQGAARNTGLRVASGEYISFLDADDYWLPEFLETCIDFLEAHPLVVAANTGYRVKQRRGQMTGPTNLRSLARSKPNGMVLDHFFSFWGKYDHIRTGTVVLRRETIIRAGGQRADLRISQDLEYWGYLATFGPWGFIPRILWVGDSASVAVQTGWWRKYRERRKLCPDVELWEERIVPRLRQQDSSGFIQVRGRVAAGYAHNKILAGKRDEALMIVKKYASSLPFNRVTRLMRFGARLGGPFWVAICVVLILRERLKG